MLTMAKRCVFLLNTRAGALKFGPSTTELETKIRASGLGAELIYTKSERDMSRKVAKCVADKVEKIVVSGGDGTVHLAVQAMAGSKSVLGILPMGTANNFATALHLPIELNAALRTIKTGRIRQVSLGKIGRHYFTESAGVGLFADALALYGAGSNKNILKASIAILKLLLFLPRARMKITLDNKEIIERAVMCTVANTFRFGASYPIAPDAILTDDFLDVVIIGNIRRREIPLYYRALRSQNLGSLPKVQVEKTRSVKIEAFKRLNVHCDDKVIGTTPASVTIAPRILRVMTPEL